MNEHGNVAVDIYFSLRRRNLSVCVVYPDLVYSQFGNTKSIPIKTRLCGIIAYCIVKTRPESETRVADSKRYLHLP